MFWYVLFKLKFKQLGKKFHWTCAACCFGQGTLLPARPNADVAWLEFSIRRSGLWNGLLNTFVRQSSIPYTWLWNGDFDRNVGMSSVSTVLIKSCKWGLVVSKTKNIDQMGSSSHIHLPVAWHIRNAWYWKHLNTTNGNRNPLLLLRSYSMPHSCHTSLRNWNN